MSDDEEAKSLAGKIQNSILLEQLDTAGSTSQEQYSDSRPDVIQDQDRVTGYHKPSMEPVMEAKEFSFLRSSICWALLALL